MSKIEEALRLMKEEGLTAHGAAVRVQLQPAAVYRRLATDRKKAAGKCPHCGQPWDGVKRE